MTGAGPGTAQAKLDALGLDWVCDMIAAGQSMAKIAAQAGVGVGSVWTWIEATPERSARARSARSRAASHWDAQAEQVLIDAKSDSVEIQRARELAQHYRWRAKSFNPQGYGDRVQVEAKVEITEVTDEALDAKLAALMGKVGGD